MLKPYFLRDLGLTDLNPLVCGIHICEPGAVYPRSTIKRHVLHYVTSGCGRYLLDDREHEVRAGDLFISHPGWHTSYVADRDDPFTYIWVSFNCRESFAALLDEDVLRTPWAAPVFARMLEACESDEPEWNICGCLFSFFAQLRSHREAHPLRREDYVLRAEHEIRLHYAEPLRIADLAASLHLSRNHFTRLFKKQTGRSPQEYLVSYRLEKAAELMTDYGFSQKEAAAQVGYPDVFAFSRMFRRVYGVPPGEYVRRCGGKG